MGKGDLQVSTILYLIIAVIILLIFAPMIVRVSGDVMNSIGMALGIVKPSNIEQAILCSYYRCIEGCSSTRMEEIKWKEGNEVVFCQDFCNPSDVFGDCSSDLADCYTDTDKLTICADKANKYPVNITLGKSEEKIEKSHLKIPTAVDVKCIIPSNAQGIDVASEIVKGILSPLTSLWNIIKALYSNQWAILTSSYEDNWLAVNSTLIKSRGTEVRCTWSIGIPITDNSVDELVIKPNTKIKIVSSYFNFLDKVKLLITGVVPL